MHIRDLSFLLSVNLQKFKLNYVGHFFGDLSCNRIVLELIFKGIGSTSDKKAELAFFFPARLFNRTKAPTMDKVHGNINGFSFTTSPCPCRGLIIRQCPWYSWPHMLKVAPCMISRTVIWSYIQIFLA